VWFPVGVAGGFPVEDRVFAVSDAETEKRVAAQAAAELVEEGMTVGLGTGSTVAHLLPAIARRGVGGIRCVATSVATEAQARELGIPVERFNSLPRLDLAIDGTDEVTPDGWLIKGGGAAHLRELLDRYGEQLTLSLAAYNAGPTAVAHWLPPTPMDPDIWIENIPYNETRGYVQHILEHIVAFASVRDAEAPRLEVLLTEVEPATPPL